MQGNKATVARLRAAPAELQAEMNVQVGWVVTDTRWEAREDAMEG